MSRIGKKPIIIPDGVKIEINDRIILVSGVKGKLDFNFGFEVDVEIVNNEVIVKKIGKTKEAPALWGTVTRIIQNMISGVSEGFQKQLELNGVGYRMSIQGKKINLALGFSHPVQVDVPEGIDVKIENNVMTVTGIDRQKVGQFSAEIRGLKPVEPYKGKGFRYVGEVVRRKEGKKTAA